MGVLCLGAWGVGMCAHACSANLWGRGFLLCPAGWGTIQVMAAPHLPLCQLPSLNLSLLSLTPGSGHGQMPLPQGVPPPLLMEDLTMLERS